MSEESVSRWLSMLKAGQIEAFQPLWNRYIGQLVALARRKLDGAPTQAADEEDVAQSVFLSLCRGAAEGRLNDVRNRDELWWLLLAITKQTTVDLIRRETAQKRGAGRVLSASTIASATGQLDEFSIDQLLSDAPTPELLAMMEEQHRHLFSLLRDEILRQIALWRLEGYSVAEIAQRLDVSTRSIERKLQLIRAVWSKELWGEPAHSSVH